MGISDDRASGVGRARVVRPVAIDPAGVLGPTRAQARGKGWRRTSRGFYVPSSAAAHVPEQRIVEASVVLPAYGGITGWAALRWQGAAWFDGLDPSGTELLPIDLVTGCADVRSRTAERVNVTHERVRPSDLVEQDDLRVTCATWSTAFAMRRAATVREAVVVLDMAYYSDLVAPMEMARQLGEQNGWTGVPQARAAWALAVENSWSPWESRLRLVWELDAELARPMCNAPIFDLNGNHIGTPDLFDPEAGVVAEYDGRFHLEGAQRRRDRSREAAFRRAGLEYVAIMSGDDRSTAAHLLAETHARAARSMSRRRTWTLRPPPWWVADSTVAQRRALAGRDRDRLLRFRRQAA